MEMILDTAIELGAEDVVTVVEDNGTEEEDRGGSALSKEDPRHETEVEVGFCPHLSSSWLTNTQIKVVAPPELLSLMTKTLSQPPHSYKLSESELQWRPIDPELAKADAEALSEESKENLSTLMNDLEEYSECVGVWSSID
jgi:transcriptional/translational regulatory protein YebC/TACO1